MKKEQFLSFYKTKTHAEICYDSVKTALEEAGILTDLTLIGALATVRVEVGKSYKPVMEMSTGEAYEGRKDLGNTTKGDGRKYKGRGYIQLTGKSNYEIYGKRLGLDLLNNPDLALTVENSARILAQYFKDRRVHLACDNRDWVLVRKLVNGGNNGLTDFKRVVGDFLKVSGL